MRLGLVAAAAAALSACVPAYFVKPGATTEDFEMDKAACAAQALGSANQNVFLQVQIVKLCLRGKGWQEAAPPRTEAPAAEPASDYSP